MICGEKSILTLERGKVVASTKQMAKNSEAKELAKRFAGKDGARLLTHVLLGQPIFQENKSAVKKIVAAAEIE